MIVVTLVNGERESYEGTGFSIDGDGRLLVHGGGGEEQQGLGYKIARRKPVVAIVAANAWVSARIVASR